MMVVKTLFSGSKFVVFYRFISKLKDKAIATGKTVKLDFEISNLNKKKKQLLFDLGKALFNCYKQGVNTHVELQTICQEMSKLDDQVNAIGNELSSLRKSYEELRTTLEELKT